MFLRNKFFAPLMIMILLSLCLIITSCGETAGNVADTQPETEGTSDIINTDTVDTSDTEKITDTTPVEPDTATAETVILTLRDTQLRQT